MKSLATVIICKCAYPIHNRVSYILTDVKDLYPLNFPDVLDHIETLSAISSTHVLRHECKTYKTKVLIKLMDIMSSPSWTKLHRVVT